MSDRDLDPDIKEVFAALHWLDEEEERGAGLPPSEKLPSIEPLELEPLDFPAEGESFEEWAAKSKARQRPAEANRGDSVRSLELVLERMQATLGQSSGSEALDAARKRVFAVMSQLHAQAKVERTGAANFVDGMEDMTALMHESGQAFDAVWIAKLEHFRTTCAPEMRPKVDKAIAWQHAQSAQMLKLHEESARAMDALRRLRKKT